MGSNEFPTARDVKESTPSCAWLQCHLCHTTQPERVVTAVSEEPKQNNTGTIQALESNFISSRRRELKKHISRLAIGIEIYIMSNMESILCRAVTRC